MPVKSKRWSPPSKGILIVLANLLYNEKVKQGSIDPVSLSTSAMETVKELESRLAEVKSKQNEHFNRKKYLMDRLKYFAGWFFIFRGFSQ